MQKLSTFLRSASSTQRQAYFTPPFTQVKLNNEKLHMTIQFHCLTLDEREQVPVIIFQSRGFSALHQSELVFVVENDSEKQDILEDEIFLSVFDQIRAFFELMYSAVISEKQQSRDYFHTKRVTVFRDKFCFHFRAVVYVHMDLPADVEKPEFNQPYVLLVGLREEEYQYVRMFGISRMLTLQARYCSIFPCVAYNRFQGEPLCDIPDHSLSSGHSFLNSVYQITSIPDVFVRRENNGCIVLEICETSHGLVTTALNELLSYSATEHHEGADSCILPSNFCLHCDIGHPQSDTHLVFSSNESKEEYITIQNQTDGLVLEVTGSFISFEISDHTSSRNSVSVKTIEDGFSVICSREVWNKHMYGAFMQRRNTNFWNETTGEIIFSVRWLSGRYIEYVYPSVLRLDGIQTPLLLRTRNRAFSKRVDKKFVSLRALLVVGNKFDFVQRLSLKGQSLLVQILQGHLENVLKMKLTNHKASTSDGTISLFKLFIHCAGNSRTLGYHCANESDMQYAHLFNEIVDELNSKNLQNSSTYNKLAIVLQEHLTEFGPSISFILAFNIHHRYAPVVH